MHISWSTDGFHAHLVDTSSASLQSGGGKGQKTSGAVSQITYFVVRDEHDALAWIPSVGETGVSVVLHQVFNVGEDVVHYSFILIQREHTHALNMARLSGEGCDLRHGATLHLLHPPHNT